MAANGSVVPAGQIAKTSDFSAFLKPEEAQDYFAEVEKTSILQRVARKVPMGPTGITIPYWNGAVQAQWIGETERKPLTKGSFTHKELTPTKIAVIFAESAEAVRANPLNYIQTMRTKIAEAIALAFDAAGMYGTNKPTAFQGYLAQSTKTQSLGTDAYTALAVTGLKKLTDDGKKWTGTLLDDTTESILNGSKDGNGRPLFNEPTYAGQAGPIREGSIVGRPTVVADHVKGGSTLGFQGDFRQVIWGQVGGLSFDVTDQATLDFGGPDPEDSSVWVPNLISLWQHNMVAVRCEAEYALLVNDPESFVKLAA